MRVTYLGHAALMIEAGGRRLLMDPWLEDPAYLSSWWHYPPLALGVRDLGTIDYVYCSHEHPDHFDPKTLRQLPPETRFLVPQFSSHTLEKQFAELGFENLIPLEFGQRLELDGGMAVTCHRTDLVWEDSALLVEADGTSVFNQNDCKLSDEALKALADKVEIDVAFLPFSGAIQFPTCYEMPDERRRSLCEERRRGHLDAFVQRARLLRPRYAVPFAGNFCLPAAEQLWMNEVNNINTPEEAVDALRRGAPDVRPLQMNPGDRWSPRGGLLRMHPAPDWSRRLEEVRALAERWGPEAERLRAAEPPARPELEADVRRYFTERAELHAELPERIDAVVVLQAEGDHGGTWSLRYDRTGFRIEPGHADDWSMRMQLPTQVLQLLVDGAVCWDEALISFRLSFAENPEFFNEAFWTMLYAPGREFMTEYISLQRPLAHRAVGDGG